VSGSGISQTICKSAPRSRQMTTPASLHSVFTGRMPFLRPTNCVKALKAWLLNLYHYNIMTGKHSVVCFLGIFSPWKLHPPMMQPLVSILWPLVIINSVIPGFFLLSNSCYYHLCTTFRVHVSCTAHFNQLPYNWFRSQQFSEFSFPPPFLSK